MKHHFSYSLDEKHVNAEVHDEIFGHSSPFFRCKNQQIDGSFNFDLAKYTLDTLCKTCMKNSKPISTLSILNYKMSVKEGTLFYDPILYRIIVGMLQNLTFTRLDDIVYLLEFDLAESESRSDLPLACIPRHLEMRPT